MASNGKAHHGINLVAILLITRSRPGPKLVFHYPPSPQYQPASQKKDRYFTDSDSDSGDEDGSIFESTPSQGLISSLGHDLGRAKSASTEDTSSTHLLGFPTEALEKALSPGRWSDRKKFEISLSGLTFVGHPIYSLEDGSWSEKPSVDDKVRSNHHVNGDDIGSSLADSYEPFETQVHDFTHVPESLDSQVSLGLGTSSHSNSTGSGIVPDQMSMFQVVFVLRTAAIENCHDTVAAVYRDVTKKLSVALHYCQKEMDYVALESHKMLSMTAKAKQRQLAPHALFSDLVETCELAWALKELYDRISEGSLATIRLRGMEISLHITSNAPASTDRLGPLSALLLLEPKDSLLRSLPHPDASPLSHFINEHTPTKNLNKHSTNLSMPLTDILYLAHHLLKWRKARIIAPLHQRNTYVVNPSMVHEDLPKHVEAYSRAFPTLPTLPNMLKVLSGRPIKYGVLIPSRDHRGPYMDILAFLVRRELVVQLKTFGWLRLIIEPDDESTTPERPKRRSVPPTGTSPNILSPHLRPSSVVPPDDDAVSVDSDRTAIAANSRAWKRLSASTQISLGAAAHALAASEDRSAPTTPSPSEPEEHDGEPGSGDSRLLPPLLLRDPSRPSPDAARRIAALRTAIVDAELREKFDALLPFFDGRHAFEEIAPKLQLKRAKVEEWLAEMDRRGWLMIVRHC